MVVGFLFVRCHVCFLLVTDKKMFVYVKNIHTKYFLIVFIFSTFGSEGEGVSLVNIRVDRK